MGSGRWDASDWDAYASKHVDKKARHEVFTSRDLKDEYDAAKIGVRESRDSADNPNSTPIILAADVTGSMGAIAHQLMSTGLNKIATEIYDRKPVTDPHIAVMAVGDAECDRAPLQVTQFEADISLADQVRELWLEGGGGANSGESYSLAHLFAGLRTQSDAWSKRGKKGYLFTIGDEPNLDGISERDMERALGQGQAGGLTAEDCLALASERYHVFHILLTNEGYAARALDVVQMSWKPLLGQHVLELDDVDRIAETVVSAIQIIEGESADSVTRSWGGDSEKALTKAVKALAPAGRPSRSKGLRPV